MNTFLRNPLMPIGLTIIAVLCLMVWLMGSDLEATKQANAVLEGNVESLDKGLTIAEENTEKVEQISTVERQLLVDSNDQSLQRAQDETGDLLEIQEIAKDTEAGNDERLWLTNPIGDDLVRLCNSAATTDSDGDKEQADLSPSRIPDSPAGALGAAGGDWGGVDYDNPQAFIQYSGVQREHILAVAMGREGQSDRSQTGGVIKDYGEAETAQQTVFLFSDQHYRLHHYASNQDAVCARCHRDQRQAIRRERETGRLWIVQYRPKISRSHSIRI